MTDMYCTYRYLQVFESTVQVQVQVHVLYMYKIIFSFMSTVSETFSCNEQGNISYGFE